MAVTFRIYAHVMRLQAGDRERLKALVNGGVLAPDGSGAPGDDASEAPAPGLPERRNPRISRGSE
jgi:hypothetical protein